MANKLLPQMPGELPTTATRNDSNAAYGPTIASVEQTRPGGLGNVPSQNVTPMPLGGGAARG